MKSRTAQTLAIVIAGAVVFAVLALVFSSVLTKNIKFLAILPFVAALFIILVLNVHIMFIFLLWSRSLMDLLLTQTRVGGGVGIGGVLNLFVIVVVLMLAARFPKELMKNRHILPWGAFLLISGATVFYAPMPAQSLRFFLSLFTYLCMFIAPFFIVKNESDKKFWVRMLFFSSFLPVAVANVGLVTHLRVFMNEGRLSGTFTHPNILAFYLVFVITVVLYILQAGTLKLKLPSRILLWLYIVNLMGLLVATQTRSAWMACGLLFLIYGFLKDRKLLIICLVAGLALTAVPQVQTRLKDLTEGTGSKKSERLNSMAWRIKLWEYAVPSIQKRIFTGHGLDSFQLLSRDFFPLEKHFGAPAHNVYVQLIFETGLFGLLSYLWIYMRLLKTFYRRMRFGSRALSAESALLFSYLIGYLVVSVSDNMLYYLAFNWYFWFFAGVLIQAGSLVPPQASAISETHAILPS